MATVSRETLRSFFQSGSKPGAIHFALLIDSLAHLTDDREQLGLRAYNPSRVYSPGEAVIFNQSVYVALQPASGDFDAAKWQAVSSSQGSAQPVFGSDYAMVESATESFTVNATAPSVKISFHTGARSGVFRLQWHVLAHHQAEGGFGKFQLVNASNGQAIGAPQIYKQISPSERIGIGDIAGIALDGNDQLLELQYQTLESGMAQYVQNAKLEIFKISD